MSKSLLLSFARLSFFCRGAGGVGVGGCMPHQQQPRPRPTNPTHRPTHRTRAITRLLTGRPTHQLDSHHRHRHNKQTNNQSIHHHTRTGELLFSNGADGASALMNATHVVHPFVGLAGPGDTASVKVRTTMSEKGGGIGLAGQV